MVSAEVGADANRVSPSSHRLGTHRDVFPLPLKALTPAAFKKTLA